MAWLFVLLQRLLPQHGLSRLVGRIGNAKSGWLRRPLIGAFIRIFRVDMSEAANPSPSSYPTFNAFFTRRLRPDARPVTGSVSSPADGTVSMAGTIRTTQLLQAKNINYSLEKLLAGPEASRYRDGSFCTVYLSPRDYHRVHMPIKATLSSARYVPGKLFSVNAATTNHVSDLFAANERLVMHFDTQMGPMAVVMVGAMIVAGIKTVWRTSPYSARQPVEEKFDAPQQFEQGAELGHFEMGSTVIVIFREQVDWLIASGDMVRMGQPLVN